MPATNGKRTKPASAANSTKRTTRTTTGEGRRSTSSAGGRRVAQTAAQTAARSTATGKKSTGKSKPPAKKGSALPLLALLGVVAVLGIGYGILCVKASASEVMFPNTRVLGVNLGGMTQAEAAEELTDMIASSYADQTIQLAVGEETVSLPVVDLISVESAEASEAAYSAVTRSGVMSGLSYLKMLVSGCDVDVTEYVTINDADAVYAMLEEKLEGFSGAVVQTEYQITDTALVITKGVSGKALDLDAVQEQILAALDSGDFTTVISCAMVTTAPDSLDLQAIYDAVYTEPVDACCDSEANIIDDTQGISFDVSAAESALTSAEEGETVTVSLVFTDAELTAAELEELLFRDVLGTASSNVSGTSARITNVKLAASLVDGTILNPGESFSYNDTVGQRTTERGFQAAAAYSGGETVLEVGGGICQVSSTIYLATLRSNLEIVERRNHTYLCSYMPYGEDATVSWGGPDFVFKNDTDYPIKIVVTYSSGVLTATVYGTNLTGEYVVVTNEVTSTTSYETVYQDTTELAAGQTQVKTSGYNGMTVKVYRNVYAADGTLISSTLESNNTYKVRNKVVLRGVGTTTTESTTTDTTPTAHTTTDSSTTATPTAPAPTTTATTPGETTTQTTTETTTTTESTETQSSTSDSAGTTDTESSTEE